MATLLDTNILVRLLQPHHSHSAIAERAIQLLHGRDEVLNIASQNLVEFWAVVTRPAINNGLDFSPVQALREIQRLKHFFTLLPETPLHATWERLVIDHQVMGKSKHDARLVAAMEDNMVENILTFNGGDFVRYEGVRVIHPRTLI